MSVGARLRERRKAAGLSAGQVEEYGKVGRQYLSKLELGTNEPPAWEILARLARCYGTSTDYFLGLTDDPSPAGGVAPPPHGEEVWQVMRQMRPALAAELVRVAEELLVAQQQVEERARRVLAGISKHALDPRAAEILAEARRISLSGDTDGANALVEGFFVRREDTQAEESAQESLEQV